MIFSWIFKGSGKRKCPRKAPTLPYHDKVTNSPWNMAKFSEVFLGRFQNGEFPGLSGMRFGNFARMVYIPSTIAGSIFSFLLISLQILSEGSPLPVMISLILAPLMPSISASFACVSPISYILRRKTSTSEGVCMG